MDARQAQEMERMNMKALGDPVFLTFTGDVASIQAGKLQPTGAKCDPGRVLDLGFLGLKFPFTVGQRQQVPRKAAEFWMRDNLANWQDKVMLVLEEAGEMVPASEKEAMQAEIDHLKTLLAAQQAAPTEATTQGPAVVEVPTTESGLNKLNKPALIAIVAKLGVEVSEDASKGMLVEAILKAQAAQ